MTETLQVGNWIPELETARLHLRPFALADAPRVQQLAGHARVADTTANIPHPYPNGAAEQWIAGHPSSAIDGTSLTWAIERREDRVVIGAVSLRLWQQHARGELGYWLGADFWNHGYMTEAARCVTAYAFEQRNLHRLQAQAMLRNPGSWRVMEKLGMQREGILRAYFKRGDTFEDIVCYAVLRDE